MNNFRNKTSGFSLIEVLVSMVVLSTGLLGLAGLQTKGMNYIHTSNSRFEAMNSIEDIMERIRANRSTNYSTSLSSEPAETTVNCSAQNTSCIPSTLATYDMSRWACSLGYWNSNSVCTGLGVRGRLPLGRGSIALSGNTYTITVMWDQNRDGDATNDSPVVAVFQP